jgi:ribosome maturation factor RimP
MKLKDTVKIEISKESLKNVLDILIEHQTGYSVDFASDRIRNIRETIDVFKEKLA